MTAAPDLNNITRQDLVEPRRLAQLYVQAVQAGFWPNSHHSALEFFVFAEKAIEEDKHGTPGKLFYSLVKQKDGSKVSGAQESRAMAKLGGDRRQRLVEMASEPRQPIARPDHEEVRYLISGEETDLTYFPSVLVQCFFPYGHWPMPEFRTQHGNATLEIEAGKIANRDRPGEFLRTEVPFGGPARVILAYIHQQALKHDVIDLGSSLREFLRRNRVPISGQNATQFRSQIDNIAGARIILGNWTEEGAHGTETKIVSRHSFWVERDERQHSLWRPELELSTDYRELLRARPVPVHLPHLLDLRKHPRAMDLYTWLTYRLPRIGHDRPIKIRWSDLHPIFGSNVRTPKNFRGVFLRDLRRALVHYPEANIDTSSTSFLVIRRSPFLIKPETARRDQIA